MHRATQAHRIQPAAATRAPGGGTKFVALARHVRADGIVEFIAVVELGGKRPGADARGIGLGDAEDVVEVAGTHAGAGAGAAGGGVRGGHVGVGAVVDIQQGALGALEHDLLPRGAHLVQHAGDIGHHGTDALGHFQAFVQYLLEVHGLGLEIVLEREVVVVEDLAEARGEAFTMEHVAHLETAAGDLVFVGRTDTTPGGTDGLLAARLLARLVQRDMIGQDQGAGLADEQTFLGRNAVLAQHVQFAQQSIGGQHHAVTDHALHTLAQDAGRDEVQDGLPAVDDEGVTGIVAALETHHGIGLLGEQIDDLALALVTPLGANDYHVLAHDWSCLLLTVGDEVPARAPSLSTRPCRAARKTACA